MFAPKIRKIVIRIPACTTPYMKALANRARRIEALETGETKSLSMNEFSISAARSEALFVDPNRTP
jgi:hypothetical protein